MQQSYGALCSAILHHILYNMLWSRQPLCSSAALPHAYVPSHIMQHALSGYITPELVPYGADLAPRGGVLALDT